EAERQATDEQGAEEYVQDGTVDEDVAPLVLGDREPGSVRGGSDHGEQGTHSPPPRPPEACGRSRLSPGPRFARRASAVALDASCAAVGWSLRRRCSAHCWTVMVGQLRAFREHDGPRRLWSRSLR